jgi:uncharacterized membrane protein YkvA (DUF1232 family)
MWKRLSALWLIVRGDAKLLWYALQHPESPSWLKAGTALVVLYLFSPIDIIPDFIPVIGLMDDLVLVPLAINWMLKRLPERIRHWAKARAQGQAVDSASVVVERTR